MPLFFNPLQEGYFDNPYAHYAELREHDPVHQSLAGLPICFAYDDIRQVLIDGTTSMNIATVKSINGDLPGADGPPMFPKSRDQYRRARSHPHPTVDDVEVIHAAKSPCVLGLDHQPRSTSYSTTWSGNGPTRMSRST